MSSQSQQYSQAVASKLEIPSSCCFALISPLFGRISSLYKEPGPDNLPIKERGFGHLYIPSILPFPLVISLYVASFPVRRSAIYQDYIFKKALENPPDYVGYTQEFLGKTKMEKLGFKEKEKEIQELFKEQHPDSFCKMDKTWFKAQYLLIYTSFRDDTNLERNQKETKKKEKPRRMASVGAKPQNGVESKKATMIEENNGNEREKTKKNFKTRGRLSEMEDGNDKKVKKNN